MIDPSADLGMLQSELAQETNKKVALYDLLITTGDELNKAKREALESYGRHTKVKTQLRASEDRIKTLKNIINSQREY